MVQAVPCEKTTKCSTVTKEKSNVSLPAVSDGDWMRPLPFSSLFICVFPPLPPHTHTLLPLCFCVMKFPHSWKLMQRLAPHCTPAFLTLWPWPSSRHLCLLSIRSSVTPLHMSLREVNRCVCLTFELCSRRAS